jgi:hypothetical protein
MPGGGAVLLGDLVAAGMRHLHVACSKCERRGRLSVARLVAEQGADIGLPDLRRHIAAGCRRLAAVSINNLCGVYYLTLPTFSH